MLVIAPLNTDFARTSVPSLTMTVPVMAFAAAPAKVIGCGASRAREFVPPIAPLKTIGPLPARHSAPDPETLTELLNVAVPVPLWVMSFNVSGSSFTLRLAAPWNSSDLMLQGWFTMELSRGVSGIMTSAVPSFTGTWAFCQLKRFVQLELFKAGTADDALPDQVKVSAAQRVSERTRDEANKSKAQVANWVCCVRTPNNQQRGGIANTIGLCRTPLIAMVRTAPIRDALLDARLSIGPNYPAVKVFRVRDIR